MRKADYNLLTNILSKQLTEASKLSDPHCRSITESVIRQIGLEFALKASVDSDAFIKACGMK